MKGIGRLMLALVVFLAAMVMAAPAAHALTFEFTSDHCTGGCGTPPFGTVTLIQNGTTVDVTVHLNAPNFFIKTGAAASQAFGFNVINTVLGDITVDSHTPGLVAASGPFHMDGTGDFLFGINCPTCGNGAPDRFNTDIVFHVSNGFLADFIANADGQFFAADIISCNVEQCGSGTGNGNTGTVDASAPVAEPGSLLFAGTAMVLAGMLGRRWKLR